MMHRQKTKRDLAVFGPRGRTVRVFLDGDLVRAQWREAGLLKTKSWANTAANRVDAKAWARGFSEAREAAPGLTAQRITLRALWEAYKLAEFGHLRIRTQQIYTECWSRWEQAWGPDFVAENATPEMLDKLRAGMEAAGLAVNTTRMAIRVAKTVHAFGERRELLARNRLASWTFKLAKEKQPKAPPEFRDDQFRQILAALDPTKPTQWRAYVTLALCGYQGARQHAVLHLRWSDIDFAAGIITWRAEWDKTGKEWTQPLRAGSRAALAHARQHNPHGEWVLPAPHGRSGVYSKQSLWWMLKATCEAVGIRRAKGQGAHSLRRMLAGNVAAETGSVGLALQAIGDTTLAMAPRYVQPRRDEIEKAFLALDRNATAIDAKAAPVATETASDNSKTSNDLPETTDHAP